MIQQDALRLTPEDKRDFKLGGLFPQIRKDEIPENYSLSHLKIKDQGETDQCTAYAVSSVSEDQEGIPLDPFYQFAATKRLDKDPDAWGADIRTALKSAVEYGSSPMIANPGSLLDPYSPASEQARAIASRFENFKEKKGLAMEHRKKSYFSVDGRHDLFDNIRIALWQNRADKCSVVAGIKWRRAWTERGLSDDSERGWISENNGPGFGHAFKICGYGYRGDAGENYLLLQLSNGERFGSNGMFYLPREIANEELTYGAYMFKDIEPWKVRSPKLWGFFSGLGICS